MHKPVPMSNDEALVDNDFCRGWSNLILTTAILHLVDACLLSHCTYIFASLPQTPQKTTTAACVYLGGFTGTNFISSRSSKSILAMEALPIAIRFGGLSKHTQLLYSREDHPWNLAQKVTVLSSTLLRIAAFIFLRWIPGVSFLPGIYVETQFVANSMVAPSSTDRQMSFRILLHCFLYHILYRPFRGLGWS